MSMACDLTAEKRKSGSLCVKPSSHDHIEFSHDACEICRYVFVVWEAKIIGCCNGCGGSVFFSVFGFPKWFPVWNSASSSQREQRFETARQIFFFLQALNFCVETSFLLGLLKWDIAVSASYLRQESCYYFSTALQPETDLQWHGVIHCITRQ